MKLVSIFLLAVAVLSASQLPSPATAQLSVVNAGAASEPGSLTLLGAGLLLGVLGLVGRKKPIQK